MPKNQWCHQEACVPTFGLTTMNKEEDLSVRACRLYEELRRASLDDSILLREEDWKRIEGDGYGAEALQGCHQPGPCPAL